MLYRRLSFHEQTTMMAWKGYAAAAAIGRLDNTRRNDYYTDGTMTEGNVAVGVVSYNRYLNR